MELSGFYKLSVKERLTKIKEDAGLSDEEVRVLTNGGALSLEIADRMVENVIGVGHLPIGIATHFKINGRETLVPMEIEEPSVIAAASNAAKLCLPEGFTAKADEPIMIGQVQFIRVKNAKESVKRIQREKKKIIAAASEFTKQIEKYGGGVKNVYAKNFRTKRGEMIVVYFDIDVRDAMGANTINTVLEGVSPFLAEYIHGEYKLRILSNLAVKRKAYAEAVWKKENVGKEVVEGVLDAYEFAKADIFRTATHNKGIMNGIDAVALATGQDWRAVEAGAHAYAALNGYKPLTHYEKNKNGDLVGRIELPLAVGTVGGAINTSPTAKICLKILGVKSAKELAMVMACVGLANNFAALRALSTEGIQKGHMKLHARNLAIIAGAKTPDEIDAVAKALAEKNEYSVEAAKKVLERIR
ncbi:MAG: hydroxymethylglutaryl-CoA reductase, degradative [Candidatus Anstonellales archaeon]